MPIVSRTPDGWPNRCPICGAEWRIESSQPTGDAPCPVCGHLVWFDTDNMRQRVESIVIQYLPRTVGNLYPRNSFWHVDSLAVVELIMELEEQFRVSFSGEDMANIQSVEELVEFIV